MVKMFKGFKATACSEGVDENPLDIDVKGIKSQLFAGLDKMFLRDVFGVKSPLSPENGAKIGQDSHFDDKSAGNHGKTDLK